MKTFYQLRNENGLFLSLIDGLRMSFGKSGKIYTSLESAETDLYWHHLIAVGDNDIQPLTIVSYTETSKHTASTNNFDFRKARDFLHAVDCEDYKVGRRRGMFTSLMKDLSFSGKSFKYVMLFKNDGELKIDKKIIVGRADGHSFGNWNRATMIALDNETDLVYARMKFSDHLIKVWDENGNILINLETES